MFHKGIVSAILIFQFFSMGKTYSEQQEGLKVWVEGVRAVPGEVGIAVFNTKKGFPIHIEHAYATEWIPLKEDQKSVMATFNSLPPGEYAISVLHDENGNRKMDRTTTGFPKEGVGFSNDQRVTLKAPGYQESKFYLSPGEKKRIKIQLDYSHRP